MLTSPTASVSWLTVWSLTPPHSGKNGPWVAFCWVGGADVVGLSGPDELVEQAATSATVAAPMAMEVSLRLTEPASLVASFFRRLRR